MACQITIVPKVGPNKGEQVESNLFNKILSLQPDPELAKSIYRKVYDPEFIKEFGDWQDDPSSVVGRVDENGEPILTVSKTAASVQGLNTIIKLLDIETVDPGPIEDMAEQSGTSVSMPGVIDELQRLKEAEQLTLDNPSDSQYKGKNESRYDRLTSFIGGLVGKDVNVDRARKAAEALFRNTRKDINADTITVEGVELNFEELVRHYERKYNTASAYGRAIHKYLEYHITKNSKALTELAYIQSPKTKEKDGIDQDAIDNQSLKWIKSDNIADMLVARSGYTSTDTMDAEVMIHSDVLGIATQIDGLYQHSDGTLSLVDWKSGAAFLTDKDTIQAMPYSKAPSPVSSHYGNSKLNQAKLEVALRALMIKEQVPDAKFRDLLVHHVERRNLGKQPYKVSLQDSLAILSNYLKKTSPDKWAELNSRGLFEFKNYVDFEIQGKLILDKYQHLPAKDQIPALENEANVLRATINAGQSNNIVKDKEQLGIIVSEILKLKDHTKSEMDADVIAEEESTGLMKSLFGATFNIKNKAIQAYTKLFTNSRLEYFKDREAEKKKADKLFKAVQDEHMASKPLAGIGEALTLGFKSFYKYKEMYNFMFAFRDGKEVSMPGFYRKTLLEAEKELASGEMTQAQFDLLKYLDETWRGTWKDVMLKTAYVNRYGEDISHAQSMSLIDSGDKRGVVTANGELSTMFFPRLPKEYGEFGEEYSGLSAPFKGIFKTIKSFASRQLTFFLEEEYYNYDGDSGHLNAVKVRYTGSEYSIAGQQHSFNLEKMHNSFMTNMYQKKHMDFPLAIADGLKSFYETKAELGKTKRFEPVLNMLEKHISGTLLQELGYASSNKIMSMPLTLSNPFYKGLPGQRKEYQVSVWKFLMMLKNIATAKAMYFKMVAGTFNGMLIFMQTAVAAMSNSISKQALRAQGLSTDDIDFTLSDLAFGAGEVAKYYADILNPFADKRDNKLYNLLKRFNYLPDNYDYAVDQQELRKLKNPLLKFSNLFFFHAIHEEWGHAVLLAAQLNKLKTADGKSVYDGYNADGTWREFNKDGSRNIRGIRKGRIKSEDQIITEITAEEALRMYKVSTLIHGAYRSWERSVMESYALGQWFLQFKKYLPSILFKEWEGRFDDQALGYHKYTDSEGNKNTEMVEVDGKMVELNVMEWHSAMHEGRARVFAKLTLASFGVKGFKDPAVWGNYQYSALSGRDRIAAISLPMQVGFTIMLMLFLSSYFEDDDENPWGKRFGYLASDGLQGFNPGEVLRTVKNPIAVITQLNNLSNGLGQMLGSGLSGDFTREGKLKGQNLVMKNVPFLSIQAELERYNITGGTKR